LIDFVEILFLIM